MMQNEAPQTEDRSHSQPGQQSAGGSRIPGFYNKSLPERLDLLAKRGDLSQEELAALSGTAGLTPEQADHMVENVIGLHALPLGIALNFVVNGREVLVPMAVEEPSVVAGASFMAPGARRRWLPCQRRSCRDDRPNAIAGYH
jgi:hydroxymethylglutaryl-CoA reductase